MDSENIVTCPIHGLKFNKQKFKMCYYCYFKKCDTCHKYRLKSDTEYNTCYDCYIQKKKNQVKKSTGKEPN